VIEQHKVTLIQRTVWLVRKGLTAFRFTESAILIALNFTVALLIMVVVVIRYLLTTRIMGLEEIALLLAMYLYYIGAARASRIKRQITVKALQLLPVPISIRKFLDTMSSFLSFGVAAFFTYHAAAYCIWLSSTQMLYEPIFEWPLYVVITSLPIGLLLISIYSLTHFVQKVRGYGYEYDIV